MVMEVCVLLGILALCVWFAERMIKAYQADEAPEQDGRRTETSAAVKTPATGKALSKTQQKAKKREPAARMQKSMVAKKAQVTKFMAHRAAERSEASKKAAVPYRVSEAQKRLGMLSAAKLGQAALGAAVAYAWLAPRGRRQCKQGGVLTGSEDFCEDDHYERECDCDSGEHNYDDSGEYENFDGRFWGDE